MGIAAVGVGIGVASAYYQAKSQQAMLDYEKRLKERDNTFAIRDLRKSGHDALLAKEELGVQKTRAQDFMTRQSARDISNSIVTQAVLGVSGNTANRITNSLYAARGDAQTTLDLEERAEYDKINEQLDTLTEATERQIAGGQVVNFQTNAGTWLQIGQGAMSGASAALMLQQAYTRYTTTYGS